MHALAIPMAFVLSLAPTGASSRFQLDFQGVLWHVSPIPLSVGASSGRTVGGGAQLGLTVFGIRIIDDESPVTLQPFVQRVSSYSLFGGGQASGYLNDGSYVTSDYGGSVDAAANIYLHRNLVLKAGFGVAQSSAGGTTRSLSLPTKLGFGVRFYDTEIAVIYRIAPVGQPDYYGVMSWYVPFWGQVEVNAFVLVGRRVSLEASLTTQPQGASAGGRVTGYLGRRFSLSAELHGGLSRYSNDRNFVQWVGGEVGALFWTRQQVGLGLRYAPEWLSAVSGSQVINVPPESTNLPYQSISLVTHTLWFTVSSRL